MHTQASALLLDLHGEAGLFGTSSLLASDSLPSVSRRIVLAAIRHQADHVLVWVCACDAISTRDAPPSAASISAAALALHGDAFDPLKAATRLDGAHADCLPRDPEEEEPASRGGRVARRRRLRRHADQTDRTSSVLCLCATP